VRCRLTGFRVLAQIAEQEDRNAVLGGKRVRVELPIGVQSQLVPEFKGQLPRFGLESPLH
jgi:hypothetical protein